MRNTKLLEVNNLEYKYSDGTQALRGIDMAIEKGKKIAVIGSNGTGKTTLFLHLNGIYKPSSGSIFFNGKRIKYNKKELAKLRSNVGIVFQDPNNQLFSASVYQEISFGPLNMGLSTNETKLRVEKTMKNLNIEKLRDKPTHFLSGGEKKKVAIASVLSMDPEVVIFDEPFASLDPQSTLDIMDIFNSINDEGKTIIISTHDVNSIYSWADYVYVMDNGKIIKSGEAQEIFNNDLLIKKTSLEKPWVLEVFQEIIKVRPELKRKNAIPKTKEELFNILAELY